MNIIINTESRMVTLDGEECVPVSREFRLTDSHFDEAAKCGDSFGLIRWAYDTQASVEEMLAFARQLPVPVAQTAKQPERKKPEPLVFPGAKPKQLF